MVIRFDNLVALLLLILILLAIFTYSLSRGIRKQYFPCLPESPIRRFLFLLSTTVCILIAIYLLNDHLFKDILSSIEQIKIQWYAGKIFTFEFPESYLPEWIRFLGITLYCWYIGAKKGFWKIKDDSP